MPIGNLETYKGRAYSLYANVYALSTYKAYRILFHNQATSILHLPPYSYGIFDATSKRCYCNTFCHIPRVCKRTEHGFDHESSYAVPGLSLSETSLDSLALDILFYLGVYAISRDSTNCKS